ncbi:diacylglycerol/lipid kinase family protein [Dyadobacter helix]|nr:diacylglycerol kinase family protein [Dyadobacter sp. CECT 9275]
MLKTNLLHNPNAGEEDFTEKELVRLIRKEGFECTYSSVKQEGWDEFDDRCDFLIIAGGDGTVRRVSKALVKRKLLQKQFPLAILPHGTANNIAGALSVKGEPKDIVASWKSGKRHRFDIGKVQGTPDEMFFLEGIGFGVFSKLIKVMEKFDKELANDVDEKIKAARAVFYDVVTSYEARQCRIIADGSDHSGKYLLVEVINTPSVGPNLILANGTDTGDGELEVVLVPEEHRGKLEQYLLALINGTDMKPSFTTIKAKHITILWEGRDLHVDDERIKLDKPVEIKVDVLPGVLEFMI